MTVFFNTTISSFHMACLGWVVYRMKYVPHSQVNLLPFLCFLARRDNWDVTSGIGTKCQRFSHKKSISAQWPSIRAAASIKAVYPTTFVQGAGNMVPVWEAMDTGGWLAPGCRRDSIS